MIEGLMKGNLMYVEGDGSYNVIIKYNSIRANSNILRRVELTPFLIDTYFKQFAKDEGAEFDGIVYELNLGRKAFNLHFKIQDYDDWHLFYKHDVGDNYQLIADPNTLEFADQLQNIIFCITGQEMILSVPKIL